MDFKLKLRHKVLFLIAVPLIFELFVFGWLYSALQEAELEIKRETYAKKVVSILTLLSSNLVHSGVSLYVYSATKDSSALQRYEDEVNSLSRQMAELNNSCSNAAEMAKLQPFETALRRGLMYMSEARQAIDVGDHAKVEMQLERLKSLSKTLSGRVTELSRWYQKIANTSPEQLTAKREAIKQMVLLAIFASLFIALALAVFFNRDTAKRLSLLIDNTKRFADGGSLAAPLKGSDEIAELDSFFHKMADAVKEASLRKQEFTAMITHDMRSPLTSLKLTLALILKGGYGGEIPDKAKEMLSKSEDRLEHIIQLINNLLDSEQLIAGRMEMHFDTAPIAHVIDRSVQSLGGLSEQKGIRMEVPTSDAEIYADPDRLIQVVMNLLSNAIKFSPENSQIAISIEEEELFLKLKIKDNGPGIPAEYYDKLFQRFQQAGTQKGSSGLGLAICKEIIELHEGAIGVEPNTTQGSTFWLRVPKSEKAMNAAKQARLTASSF